MSAEEKLKLIEKITVLEDHKLLASINHLIDISKPIPSRKSLDQFNKEIDASMKDSQENNIISEKDLRDKVKTWI